MSFFEYSISFFLRGGSKGQRTRTNKVEWARSIWPGDILPHPLKFTARVRKNIFWLGTQLRLVTVSGCLHPQMMAGRAFSPAKIGCQIWNWLVTRIPGYKTFSSPETASGVQNIGSSMRAPVTENVGQNACFAGNLEPPDGWPGTQDRKVNVR